MELIVDIAPEMFDAVEIDPVGDDGVERMTDELWNQLTDESGDTLVL